jgi:hypothetical protein
MALVPHSQSGCDNPAGSDWSIYVDGVIICETYKNIISCHLFQLHNYISFLFEREMIH